MHPLAEVGAPSRDRPRDGRAPARRRPRSRPASDQPRDGVDGAQAPARLLYTSVGFRPCELLGGDWRVRTAVHDAVAERGPHLPAEPRVTRQEEVAVAELAPGSRHRWSCGIRPSPRSVRRTASIPARRDACGSAQPVHQPADAAHASIGAISQRGPPAPGRRSEAQVSLRWPTMARRSRDGEPGQAMAWPGRRTTGTPATRWGMRRRVRATIDSAAGSPARD